MVVPNVRLRVLYLVCPARKATFCILHMEYDITGHLPQDFDHQARRTKSQGSGALLAVAFPALQVAIGVERLGNIMGVRWLRSLRIGRVGKDDSEHSSECVVYILLK